jgi:hypothetical protein
MLYVLVQPVALGNNPNIANIGPYVMTAPLRDLAKEDVAGCLIDPIPVDHWGGQQGEAIGRA